ncbi:hypothetical protein LEL_00302 [Akanthomyces lecanii RCEF 1005]|uniref:Uncharacterized protein n=1 Tax=Akanthomyces lecanii RCEF 1005 TaxID=1081108 RepID=A0A168JQY4_CORDF|nr:hypothetical protein LEL_00302 [Akanthomyces lecanii RCEF 1005]
MEDQFGGRTDDDLFFDDDFEPVDGVTTIVPNDVPVEISSYYITPSDLIPHPADLESALAPLAAAAAAGKRKGRRRRRSKSPKQPPPPPPPPRGGLAHSRFAEKPAQKPPQHPEPQSPESSSAAASHEQTNGESGSSAVIANAPTHRDRRNDGRNQGKPPPKSVDARAQSGANPRQKPTEEELTAKMEKMKLLSAEKTRKFEKAEQDEKQHAEAYARGMEEARRQRAENVERRRQNEEQRRRLEDERTKNRERKLKAMNMKEGGWDEGKEAAGEEESRRPARGMNGGVRGAKSSLGSGLRGSRFARDSSEGEKATTPDRTDTDMSLDERPRRGGRGGRGRGSRGEGRGARGGRGGRGRGGAAGNAAPAPDKDDFPSLPAKSDGQKEPVEGAPKPAILAPLPRFAPAIGKWDDEMEFLDEMTTTTTAANK